MICFSGIQQILINDKNYIENGSILNLLKEGFYCPS